MATPRELIDTALYEIADVATRQGDIVDRIGWIERRCEYLREDLAESGCNPGCAPEPP